MELQELGKLLLTIIFCGLGVLGVARVVPGIHLRGGFRSVVIIALGSGLILALLIGALDFGEQIKIEKTISIFIGISSVALLCAIYGIFALWHPDKITKYIEFDSYRDALIGSLILSVISIAFVFVLDKISIFNSPL